MSVTRHNLWFTEVDPQGLKYSFAIDQVLFQQHSDYQLVEVVNTLAYGRMLLLDGLVMTTDNDEFIYHEIMAHLPSCLHLNPKRALVIGGGDGGVVRELGKYNSFEEIALCEIDGMVIDVAKKFFPKIAAGFSDPRVKVHVEDGVKYIAHLKPQSLDLIIIDSTDSDAVIEGNPAGGLFTGEFYKSVAKALKPDGLMIAQTESPWFSEKVLRGIQSNISCGFKYLKPLVAPIPTYPRGLWSWTLASQNHINPEKFDRKRFATVKDSLKFLSEDVFLAVFSLPGFYAKKVSFVL